MGRARAARRASACRRSRRRRATCRSASASCPSYHCHWHGHKGYSGVGVYLRARRFPARARPSRTPRSTTRTASSPPASATSSSRRSTCPTGTRTTTPRCASSSRSARWVAAEHARGPRLVLCGDLNVALEERDVHPKLRNPEQIGQTARGAGAPRRDHRHAASSISCASFDPDDDDLFTWWAPWRNLRERNIGWRLDYVLASEALAARATACTADARVRHQRPRPGHRRVRRAAGRRHAGAADRPERCGAAGGSAVGTAFAFRGDYSFAATVTLT